MRVWDVEPSKLCNRHLLGQHNEIHGLWTVITQDRTGYRNHPETRRWSGARCALWRAHEETAAEMARRGFNHRSPIDSDVPGKTELPESITPIEEQIRLLAEKHRNDSPPQGVEVCGVG